MSKDDADIPIAQAADVDREENPYASPLTEGRLVGKYDPNSPVGIWRHGNSLLMHAYAELPPRCVLMNVKCDETERRVYLINSIRLINIMAAILMLVYAGVATLFVATYGPRYLSVGLGILAIMTVLIWQYWKKRPERIPIGYSLSHSARQRRLRWRCVGVILFCLGLACFPLILAFQHFLPAALGFLIGGPFLLLAGGILFAAFGFPLRFEKHAGPYFLIHGCGKSFLMSFPESGLDASQQGMISLSAPSAFNN